MKSLILYYSTDGQTLKIAHRLATEIRHDVEVISLKSQAVDFTEKLTHADQIIIGASIRYGHFNPLVYQFIEKYTDILNRKPSAFYGVNLTARKVNRKTPETNTYVRKFLARIKWKPTHNEVIAGALYYPRYRFFDRIMIQLIMKITQGETDTSKEYEYTDWQQVSDFAKRLSEGLQR